MTLGWDLVHCQKCTVVDCTGGVVMRTRASSTVRTVSLGFELGHRDLLHVDFGGMGTNFSPIPATIVESARSMWFSSSNPTLWSRLQR